MPLPEIGLFSDTKSHLTPSFSRKARCTAFNGQSALFRVEPLRIIPVDGVPSAEIDVSGI